MIRLVMLALMSLMVGLPPVTWATAPKAKEKGVRTVAILIFEGVELLDFAGPAEVFIVANEGKAFRVVTVAEKKGLVKTMGGLTVQADFAYADAPTADIVVIPGGNMKNVGKEGRRWLKDASKKAEIVLSVCMGAFLAADAGLLDDVEATTHTWGIERLKKVAPTCKVVTGRRFVDAGKVVSTAGVTAGIDGALHVVERLLGKEAARWASEDWMEYKRAASGMKD
ncbi:MAG: DJ-1/PfpI family protein [Gemmataceae bacterium]